MAKSLANRHAVTRFGTEGSVVQIHSPRPIPKKAREIKPAGALGFSFGSTSRNRVLATSNPDFIQNRSRFLASVARHWSIHLLFEAKCYPRRYPTPCSNLDPGPHWAREVVNNDLAGAIREKRLIEFSYKGGRTRVVEPHDYGIRGGIERLLGFQISGQSASGASHGWKCWNVVSPAPERIAGNTIARGICCSLALPDEFSKLAKPLADLRSSWTVGAGRRPGHPTGPPWYPQHRFRWRPLARVVNGGGQPPQLNDDDRYGMRQPGCVECQRPSSGPRSRCAPHRARTMTSSSLNV
jgi:hypothetical protein